MILSIDTSTSAIAVAVGELDDSGGIGLRDRREVVDPRAHTELLAPLIAQSLAAAGVTPADLDRIVVGTGPGPFTGLRVGLVTAVTMGRALGVPVHGVCSLDALAHAAAVSPPADGEGRVASEVLVATDARRREVYWARYVRSSPAPAPAPAPALAPESEAAPEPTPRPAPVSALAQEPVSTPSQPGDRTGGLGESDAPGALGALVPGERVTGGGASGTWVRTAGPAVDRPSDLPDSVRRLPTLGRGPALFPDLFPDPVQPHEAVRSAERSGPGPVSPVDVNAAWLLAVAGPRIVEGEPMPVTPLYLRRPDALTTAERAAR